MVIEVGGWSHCRRYFIKALDSDPDRAKTALSYITALSLLERQLAPLFWSQTLQQPQTQQRLRENLLRGALLSELR